MLSAVVLIFVLTVSMFAGKDKRDAESEEFYKYARYLFTKDERKIFRNLPTAEARRKFIRYFWELRDPNPYTEENEFKNEMEERFEFVTKYLREGPVPGWKTDRGRIFILLGAPHNTHEDTFNTNPNLAYKGVIYWYYEDSNILAVFKDKEGQGSYRLDLLRTSMRLLDELDNRKYYIVNKDDGSFSVDLLDVDLAFDGKNGELVFKVAPTHVNFEKDGGEVTAKFKVALMIYGRDNAFSRHTEIKTVTMDEAALLNQKKIKLEFRVSPPLPKGKVKIDAIVTDYLGDATRRKFIGVNIK